MTTWNVTEDKILTREEINSIIADLKRKARRTALAARHLVLFRLSCCCGLRVSEICNLRLSDVNIERKQLKVNKGKGGKDRVVPIHWDQGTLDDLAAWKDRRKDEGAKPKDHFIITRKGTRLDRAAARRSFQSACRCLGKERADSLTIHHGRHSFVSHALDGGKNIVEVQRAAGHSNVATTSIYCHLVNSDQTVGNLFG